MSFILHNSKVEMDLTSHTAQLGIKNTIKSFKSIGGHNIHYSVTRILHTILKLFSLLVLISQRYLQVDSERG